jgi:hypothetical protein
LANAHVPIIGSDGSGGGTGVVVGTGVSPEAGSVSIPVVVVLVTLDVIVVAGEGGTVVTFIVGTIVVPLVREDERFTGSVVSGRVVVTSTGIVVGGRVAFGVNGSVLVHPAQQIMRIVKDITHTDIRIQCNFSALPALLIE